ncbi:hypothetical protein [Micromonospora eburnea]|uniref:hypothetical protein n=1 Tax=Micromonospora eburnea TaxID=227316 RepID=UPI001428A70C|nr:hypothetical protein [Micromonospora eburnea]
METLIPHRMQLKKAGSGEPFLSEDKWYLLARVSEKGQETRRAMLLGLAGRLTAGERR